MFLCEPFTFASSFQAWQKQDVPVLHKLVVPVAEEAAIAATWQSLSILQVKMSTKPHTHTPDLHNSYFTCLLLASWMY